MFDKTISVSSTDGAVNLEITAGTEGLKSMFVKVISEPSLPAQQLEVTQFMDIIAPAIEAWWAKKLSS